ncbi:hypothetical protein BJ165DRAFT_149287 [Panaeolus papilionaceus]|nr:hypothetical protein BJ165DRAFT_149287 [Panaeolus papilionaceus]
MALRNITVDDTNSMITYTPPLQWTRVPTTLAAGGGHMLANYNHAEATITFIFLNMYYIAARWNYPIGGVVIWVDGHPFDVDMQDKIAPPSPTPPAQPVVGSDVVWAYKGDGMKERTIKITNAIDNGLVVVDMFIFELDGEVTNALLTAPGWVVGGDPGPSTSNPSDPPPTSSSTNTPRGLSSQAKAMAISLSMVGAALLGFFLFFLYWFYIHKSHKQGARPDKSTTATVPPPERQPRVVS